MAKVGHVASQTFDVLKNKASEHIQPRLEEALERWTTPENLESLQSIMAMTAQWGFKVGFANDPKAKRLFDFAAYIEDRHGRKAVLMALAQFNPILDGSLIELLQARYAAWPKIDRPTYDARMHRVRLSFLHLLCALGRLEEPSTSDRRVNMDASIEDMIEFFEQCDIPAQFHILARLAAGDDAAFAQFDGDPSEEDEDNKAPGFLDKLKDILLQEEPDTPQNTALVTDELRPFDVDPKFHFLVNSYTFFLQTYTTRALVESFPELITWAKQMDQRVEQEQQRPEVDVIDIH